MSNVRIESDGTANGTKVYVDDVFISGITKAEIEPIKPDGIVTAKLTIDMVSLRMAIKDADIDVTDMLAKESIKQALLDG